MRKPKRDYESKEQKRYYDEVDKQYEVVYGAAIICFKELYHWTDERMGRLFESSESVWTEIKLRGSMQNVMQLCEAETGIILDLKGKPYKDVDVFRFDWAERNKTINQRSYIYDCSRPWVANGFLACLLIALHRIEHWGKNKKLPEFIENVRGVTGEWRSAYNYTLLLNNNYDIQFSWR